MPSERIPLNCGVVFERIPLKIGACAVRKAVRIVCGIPNSPTDFTKEELPV
jgi:hypothetical protein